jgi:DNA-binding beta-propeller fold protein YncE
MRQINAATGAVITVAGTLGVEAFADGRALSANFSQMFGLAADATGGGGGGRVFIADKDNHRVRVYSPNSPASGGGTEATVATVAGTGKAVFADSAVGANASFASPSGVAVDAAGNILVADRGNHRIRRISAASAPLYATSTLAGTGAVSSTDGLGATAASFNQPTGVAVDAAGNVFVAEFGAHRVRVVQKAARCDAGVYCPAGSSSRAGRGPCPAGFYCQQGADRVPCPPGVFCPAGSSSAAGAGLCNPGMCGDALGG